jgi:membrane-associated phospholipid phosphatase
VVVLFCFLGDANAQSEPLGRAVPQEQAQAPKNVTPGESRPVSWKGLVPNLVDDQRQIWTFPVKVAKGKHLVPTLAITAVTAGLIALDPHDTPYFRRTNDFSSFNQVFSSTTTAVGTAIVPAAFYLIGLKQHDAYAQKTALFAGESLADAVIVSSAIKAVSRRSRPSAIPPHGDFSDTWFKTGWGSSFNGAASFPSGHTIAAFSVATVIARRCGNRRWVPWVAYGLAGLVGFSRVTNQAHFPSDVFIGAALGYSISRFAVLRQ